MGSTTTGTRSGPDPRQPAPGSPSDDGGIRGHLARRVGAWLLPHLLRAGVRLDVTPDGGIELWHPIADGFALTISPRKAAR